MPDTHSSLRRCDRYYYRGRVRLRVPLARIADHRTHASAYDIAQRPGTGNELTDDQRQMLAALVTMRWR